MPFLLYQLNVALILKILFTYFNYIIHLLIILLSMVNHNINIVLQIFLSLMLNLVQDYLSNLYNIFLLQNLLLQF